MAELLKIVVTKAKLGRIPDSERIFYLMAGQIANDINILGRLVIFATNTVREDQAHQLAGLAQLLLLLKLFAGRLFAGHLLIRKMFSAQKLRDKYRGEIGDEGIRYLDELNRYFGNSKNAIELIRNSIRPIWAAFRSRV